MQFPPTPEDVHALVAELDELDRKVLGGLATLMIAEPGQVRDQEWLAERFVQVAIVAHGFDADEQHATTEDVQTVERYAKEHMPAVLNAAFALFVRTAQDLKERSETYSLDDARRVIVSYLIA